MRKQEKINLIIFPGNFLPHVGGLETHVDEFAKYLSKNKKYNITIFSPNVVGAKSYEKICANVEVFRYPAFEAVHNFPVPKFWSVDFWNMFFNLYHKKFDIVMTRTRFFTNSTLGLLFAKFRFRQKKLIHVEHGSDFVKLSSKFKSFVSLVYDMIFGKLLFFFANKNIAISIAVKKFVCDTFVDCKKEKVEIIKRGVDFDLYEKNSSKKLLKKFDGKVKVCFLGRLYKWKGVENAIYAYKNLSVAVQKKCVYLVVGYGEDLDRLKRVAGDYLNNGIYFLGKRSFSDSIEILKESDVYLHSAYKGGGLSNSLLQAMMCECCVVASPNEGADEVVKDGENGVLLKNNSVGELQKGLSDVVSDKKLRLNFGKSSKKYIKDNFDYNKLIDKDPVYNTKNKRTSNIGLKHLKKFVINL